MTKKFPLINLLSPFYFCSFEVNHFISKLSTFCLTAFHSGSIYLSLTEALPGIDLNHLLSLKKTPEKDLLGTLTGENHITPAIQSAYILVETNPKTNRI